MDWVNERAKFNVRQAFKDLTEIVESDVGKIMALEPEMRRKRKFNIEEKRDKENNPLVEVHRLSLIKEQIGNVDSERFEKDGRVLFQRTETEINIFIKTPTQENAYRLQLYWDLSTGTGQYIADGLVCKLWEVSRDALYPLFFE